jgi:hypothetical protein
MYIVLQYSLTSVQWSKITELDYRFATIQRHLRLHLLYNSVTERNICDGKEIVCDGKDILVYNNRYPHKPKCTKLNITSLIVLKVIPDAK